MVRHFVTALTQRPTSTNKESDDEGLLGHEQVLMGG
jgi:hypothetical protein